MWKYNSLIVLAGLIMLSSCGKENPERLKIYTRKIETEGDSIYQNLSPFSLTNQRGETVNNGTLVGKIYVTDFFFTSCPTICPRMKSQLLRVFKKYNSEPDLLIVSHSIDPEYDNVDVLEGFSKKLDAYEGNWHFLTGDKALIYQLAKEYMVTAMVDKDSPGGYAHSGAFILVDQNGLIRGYYDGTNEAEVSKIIEDIQILLNENKKN